MKPQEGVMSGKWRQTGSKEECGCAWALVLVKVIGREMLGSDCSYLNFISGVLLLSPRLRGQ